MSAAPVRFASGGRGYDTRNCASVTKEAAMEFTTLATIPCLHRIPS